MMPKRLFKRSMRLRALLSSTPQDELLSVKVCPFQAFRICDHCNKEYELQLYRDGMSGGHGHNFSNCSLCGERNDVWIRIAKAPKEELK